MFFFITAPYNRITKLTQESEIFIYENFKTYLFMYDILLLDGRKHSFFFWSDDEHPYSILRRKSFQKFSWKRLT